MLKLTRTLMRVGSALIPVKSVRKRVRRRLIDGALKAWIADTVPVVRARYAENARRCREKLARGEKLRVCFLVCDSAMFSAEPVYAAMLEDERFDPFIAVVPRVTRGEAFLRETLEKAVSVLTPRYGRVVRLYDPDTGRKSPMPDDVDIVFTSIVYANQTFPEYTVMALSRRSLVACIHYGYGGLFHSTAKAVVCQPEISLMWRFFISNQPTLETWRRVNPVLSDALVLSGYAKMDRLAAVPRQANRPTTVVIAPHHSLPKAGPNDGLTLSTFLDNADFFLRLPALYPQVRFVFRPHPLLFPRLATREWWGEARTAEYRAKMESHPNVEFQVGGDYFETFANSDALIHDCGSFLAEYFYVGKPQCYLLASDATIDREFLPFGKTLLEHSYRAYGEGDIRRFLDEVVLAGRDEKRAAREALAKTDVCCFYPHAADRVIAATVAALETGVANG